MVEVTFERLDGVLFISASGRLEAGSAPAFLKSVRAEIEDVERAVIMDFEKLEYLGSAGLRVVFMTASELEKRGARLAVCSPPKPIAKVIRLSGMEQLIPVHPSREDALAAL
ncbi:MAG: STAS domain-containing protein [Rhodospirillales bacterium]|nr:STAS domain-containing protein [Rhodospirillales bacterium]